jgi:L-fucose isomerase-like protein
METGALCGTQQATCYLHQLGKPYRSVFGEIKGNEQLGQGLGFLRAAALRYELRRAKIGLAGQRVRGMTEVAANEMVLKKIFGCRILSIDLVALLRQAREADPARKQQVWESVKKAAACSKVPDESGLESAGMYLAIREIIAGENLSALAFGCYPDYMGFACVAASLLADEGIPIACEGDVNGAIGMLILQHLTGWPTHNTDWLDPLPDGSVVFTHCGSSSYSLAENNKDIVLSKVRLANRGVCSLFPAKSGPVTLLGLLPVENGYQLAILEGEALPAEMVFPGNPLRVKFSLPVNDVIEWISAEGIGHHWIAGYGHLGREIKDLAGIIGKDLRLTTIS